MQPTSKLAAPLWIIAILSIMVVLNFAATLFAPIFLAVVLGGVLSPASEAIERLGLPTGIGPLVTLIAALFLIVTLLFLLEPVLTTIINRAPLIWFELRETIETLQSAMRGLEQTGEQMAEVLGSEEGTKADEEAVVIPSATQALLYAPGYAARVMVFVGTLYFFLLSRVAVYEWIERLDINLNALDMRAAEKQVSRYFLTISMINFGFGSLVAVMLMGFGMSYALVWGFGAALANYILYLGPPIFAAGLLVGGIVAFDGPISFLPAGLFVLMNMIEGQFVTPSLVGRSMDVNPLLVFVSLVIWLWMWGPVGGIIAIPLFGVVHRNS